MAKNILKRNAFGVCLVACILLSGCGNSKATVPNSSDSYVGTDYETVLSIFEEAGFENVTVEVVEDLGSTEITADGAVESISVDGKIDFASNSKFPKDAPVVITYHTFKMVVPPSSAEKYIGSDYNETLSELQEAGFENITPEVIEDLTSNSPLPDGYIESISIDGSTDFTEVSEFYKDTPVSITYHAIKKLSPPINSSSIKEIDYRELTTMFTDAGFVNVQEKEVFDLNPDYYAADDYRNEVSICGQSSFDSKDQFPFDGKVSIVCHRPYEKYTINVHIDCVPNWLFNKYDVDFYFDGVKQGTIPHGGSSDFSFRVEEGSYIISFKEELHTSELGSARIDVSCDTDVTYRIGCYTDSINVTETFIDRKRELKANEVRVPNAASEYKYKHFEEVTKSLKDIGFINVSTEILYDIVFGWTSEGEVKSVSIDGQTDFNKGAIFDKTSPVIVTYHMLEDDDPSKIELPAGSDDYIGMNYLEVEKALRNIGLTNITFETVTTSDSAHEDGSVCCVEINLRDFDKGDKVDPDDEVVIEYYVYEEPSPVFYSTNDRETAKHGNSGVFSYKSRGGSYDVYWIIDFEAGYVYNFTEGNGESYCDRVKIVSGDLNDNITVTWHDGGDEWSWGLHFKYKNTPETLVVNDHLGLAHEFYTTDLGSALSIRNGKTIKDY